MLPPPPGRRGLPFLGEAPAFVRDPAAFLEERYRRFGPVFRTRLLGDDVVCLVGPEAFAFFNDPRFFTRQDASPAHIEKLLDRRGLIFLDDEAHRTRKDLLMHGFTDEALAPHRPAIDRLISVNAAAWAAQGHFRWVPELKKLAFAVFDAVFIGVEAVDPDPRLVDAAWAFGAGIVALPLKLPFTTYGRAVAARDLIEAHLRGAIERDAGAGHHVAARCATGLAREELVLELTDFYDTLPLLTAALAWLVVALAEHPDVEREARRAVAEGDVDYVRSLSREARRVYTIVSNTFFARARQDCEFGGYRVPEGWKALAAVEATLKDERWFPDPARFDPGRFADGLPGDAWVTHGSYPHRCVGEMLVDLTVEAFATHLLANYEWELREQDLAPKPAGLARLPGSGLDVRFHQLRAPSSRSAASGI